MRNQGFQGEVRALGSVAVVQGRNKAAISNLHATKQVSDNENVHHRQPTEGYRYHTQRNLTHGVVGRTPCFVVTDRPPFFPFLLGVPCRLRNLAVQRCGSGL